MERAGTKVDRHRQTQTGREIRVAAVCDGISGHSGFRLTLKVIVEVDQHRENASAIGSFHEATLCRRKEDINRITTRRGSTQMTKMSMQRETNSAQQTPVQA